MRRSRTDRVQPVRCHDVLSSRTSFPPLQETKTDDTEAKRWGIFGRVNVGTKFDEISDGHPTPS